MAWHNEFGKFGEDKVYFYLLDLGYTVLERNWRIGHRELDFVCLDGEVLVVVEVKTRGSEKVDIFEVLDYKKKKSRRGCLSHEKEYSTGNTFRFGACHGSRDAYRVCSGGDRFVLKEPGGFCRVCGVVGI